MELLLIVENHLLINDKDLIVLPAIDFPATGIKPFSEQVVIKHPDGHEITLFADFVVEHLSFTGGDERTDLILLFHNSSKDMVPIGSQVFISPTVIQSLKRK